MKKLLLISVCIGVFFSFFETNVKLYAQDYSNFVNQDQDLQIATVDTLAVNVNFFNEESVQRRAWNWISGGRTERAIDTVSNVAQTTSSILNDPWASAREGILIGLYKWSQGVAWAATVVGTLFDGMILAVTPTTSDWTIKGLSGIVGTALNGLNLNGIQTGVEISWKIVRDIANILIVFSLLYLGIRTIIGGKGFADKKTLGAIIIAAILVNFSLVLTKDVAFYVSNKIGIEVFQQINFESGEKSFSGAMLNTISPQILFTEPPPGGSWNNVFDTFGKVIFLSFILFVAMAIFVGMIGMLFYRFAVFVLLMILSPVGLVAFAIPWFKSYGQKWFEELKKQTIFFPAFVFCMYIIFLLIGTLMLTPSFTDESGTIGGMIVFLFNFVLVIIFMTFLLVLPGKIGGAGSDVVSKAGGWGASKARNWATAGTFGVGARALRFGVGAGGAAALAGSEGSDRRKNLQIKSQGTGLGAFVAKQQIKRSEGLKGRTFDMRNTSVAKSMGAEKYLGKGIKSWNEEVKTKQKDYKDKLEKDKKMFGYDKIAERPENQNAIRQGRIMSAKLEDNLKNAEQRYKTTGDSGDLKILQDAKKALELNEQEIGKFKNMGDHLIRLHHQKSWSNRLKLSATKSAAHKKDREELNKKWKKDGMSKDRKKEFTQKQKLNKELFDDGDSGKNKEKETEDGDTK